MNKKFTFHQMEPSDVITQHANQQLAKIEHFLADEPTPIVLELTFHDGKPHAHFEVEFLLKTPHYEGFVKREGPHFYQVLDEVIDAMYYKLQEDKDKRMEDRKMKGRHEEFKKQR